MLLDLIADRATATAYLHLGSAYQAAGRSGDSAEAFGKAKDCGLRTADLHPIERKKFAGELMGVLADHTLKQ